MIAQKSKSPGRPTIPSLENQTQQFRALVRELLSTLDVLHRDILKPKNGVRGRSEQWLRNHLNATRSPTIPTHAAKEIAMRIMTFTSASRADGRRLWACIPNEQPEPVVIILPEQGALLAARAAEYLVDHVQGLRKPLRPKIEASLRAYFRGFENVFLKTEHYRGSIGDNVFEAMQRALGPKWPQYFTGHFPTRFHRPADTLAQLAKGRTPEHPK